MANINKVDWEILRKKLLYKSVHRGCKETDILLGEFAKQKLSDFNFEQLLLYKDFIEEDDLKIYNWLLRKEDFPDKYGKLINEIGDFHKL